ncbi:MAG: hypothetical protein M3M84_07670 [Thermoproteota archaeon]|nr:hypothetical protein [Thermoproteota archaeon]
MQQERIKISQLPLFLQTALFKNYR